MMLAAGDVPGSVLVGERGHNRYVRLVVARVSDSLAVPIWGGLR